MIFVIVPLAAGSRIGRRVSSKATDGFSRPPHPRVNASSTRVILGDLRPWFAFSGSIQQRRRALIESMPGRRSGTSCWCLAALILLVALLGACTTVQRIDRFEEATGAYLGLEAPKGEVELFLPGLVSTHQKERCVTFLDSGRVCLFTTDRGGTWFTRLQGESWTRAEPVPFNYGNDMLDYTAGPDGQTLVFMTSRPTGPDDPDGTFHPWIVEWNGTAWEEPVPLPGPEKIPGTGSGYPTMSADGTLFFISDARDGSEKDGIFRCRLVDGEYGKAELVEYPVNSKYIDFDPYVSPDGSYLLFNSNRPGGFGRFDTYVCFRQADGGWSAAVNLGEGYNSEYSEACPNVTPDGKYLFFVSTRRAGSEEGAARGRDVYWTDASIIETLRSRFARTRSSAADLRANGSDSARDGESRSSPQPR